MSPGLSPQEVFVLIPSYQPDPILLEVVGQLAAQFERILVINDGSDRAGSAEIFAQVAAFEQVTLLEHETNQGKGAALKTGLNWAEEHLGENYGVITVDADGQHRCEDVVKLRAALGTQEESTLVMGERAFSGEVPLKSKFGNYLTRFLTGVVHQVWLTDTQTGLRGFDQKLAKVFLQIPQNRYEFEMEMLIRCGAQKIPLSSVAIETIYIEENENSHFRPLVDSARVYFVLFRFILSSLVTSAADFTVFSLLIFAKVEMSLAFWIGRTVGALVNFYLNRSFTFHSHQSVWVSGLKFFLRWLVLGNFSLFVTRQLVALGGAIVPMRAIAEAIAYLANFFVQKLWVFAAPKEPSKEP